MELNIILPVELCLIVDKWKTLFEFHDRLLKAQNHLQNHFIRFPMKNYIGNDWSSFISTFEADFINREQFTKNMYKTKSEKLITMKSFNFPHNILFEEQPSSIIEISIKKNIIENSVITRSSFNIDKLNLGFLIEEGYGLIMTVIFLFLNNK